MLCRNFEELNPARSSAVWWRVGFCRLADFLAYQLSACFQINLPTRPNKTDKTPRPTCPDLRCAVLRLALARQNWPVLPLRKATDTVSAMTHGRSGGGPQETKISEKRRKEREGTAARRVGALQHLLEETSARLLPSSNQDAARNRAPLPWASARSLFTRTSRLPGRQALSALRDEELPKENQATPLHDTREETHESSLADVRGPKVHLKGAFKRPQRPILRFVTVPIKVS